MRLDGRRDLGHLSYCTNIHAGESWPQMQASLRAHVPAIKAAVCPDRPMGLGLRIAAEAMEALRDPSALEDLKALLAETGTYVFTINGFPYGAFHGTRVKQDVYAPDWSTPERLAYSNALADLLAALMPADLEMGSISTVPGTFKGWLDAQTGANRIAAIVENLIVHTAHLVELEQRTGRWITLALEPEPCCFLETIEETVRFFGESLFTAASAARLGELTGLSDADALEALRRHLGVCYDVCHAAVEYEDLEAGLQALETAGIPIFKLQLSSAIRIPRMDSGAARALAPFSEPVYLHQVIEQRVGELVRYIDLPDALTHAEAATGNEWRVHFHVPVFLSDLEAFSTTQGFLKDVIARHREQPIAPHLEVETYTWDVLPETYRTTGLSEAIARELDWVIGELTL